MQPKTAKPAKKKIWPQAGIFFVFFVLTTAVLIMDRPTGMASKEYVVGEPAPRTLFSPFEFDYINENATLRLREQKSEALALVYRYDKSVHKDAQEKLDFFFDSLQPQKPRPENTIEKKSVVLSEAALKTFSEEATPLDLREETERILEQALERGLIESRKKTELLDARINRINLINGDEKETFVRDLATPDDLPRALEPLLPHEISKNKNLKSAVLEILTKLLQPNLFFDEAETKLRRKKIVDAIPEVEESVKKDELLVQRGSLVTQHDKERINQMHKKMTEHKVLNQLLAVGLLVFTSFLLCFTYLFHFDLKTFRSPKMVFLICSVFLLTLTLCKTIALWPNSSFYLMPTAMASALLVLLVHPRLGFLSSAMMAILIGPLCAFAPDIILATLLSGAAATFAALRVRKRIEFLRLGAAVGISSFLVVFVYRIFQEYTLIDSFQISVVSLINGLLITYPLCLILLWVFETLFNLTTDITLLELSDLNHPLLKRMIIEAPGTYHHSLVVSTLAESACESIGANSLLARVGSYFHDIGKIPRAEFFTENQANKHLSKHEKLTPDKSCQVILNHVRDGIELGKHYKLKDRILRFIPEHQGTGVIYFFYRKALDNAKPGEQVNIEDYRYPGPKPQSRETAVTMLSDSVEAASRSLKEPNQESIRKLVRKIINDKFIDGQLDECDLTLRDLYKIQESFVLNLMAIFHTRVSYPQSPLKPDNPDLFDDAQFEKFRADKSENLSDCC
jgi:cyclic-di-AMP phosphodiesterase PgpH